MPSYETIPAAVDGLTAPEPKTSLKRVLGAAAHVLLVEPPHLLREFLRRRRQIFGLRRRRDLLAHALFGGADRRLRRLDGAARRRLRLVGLRALLARHLDQARLHRRQLLAQPRLGLAARLLELRARVDAGLVDEPDLLGELRLRLGELRLERDEARGDAKRLRRERDESRKEAASLRQKLDDV